jgi:hypothetical protein
LPSRLIERPIVVFLNNSTIVLIRVHSVAASEPFAHNTIPKKAF